MIDNWFFRKDNLVRIKLSDRVTSKNTEAWLPLREELMPGMKAPKSAFIEVTADEVINRNKQV